MQQLSTARNAPFVMAAEMFLLPHNSGFVLPGAAEADVGDEDSSGGDDVEPAISATSHTVSSLPTPSR